MTTKIIDYFLSIVSPFTYLGHQRFVALAKKHSLTVNYKPADIMKVFSVSGGVPVKQRAPQRQAYRLTELQRWRDFLGIPLNPEPKYFPVDDLPATCVVLVAMKAGADPSDLIFRYLRAVWAEDRNVADMATIRAIVKEAGGDDDWVDASQESGVDAQRDANSREAIGQQVFGAPTYVYNGELFWGQDRLELLAWRLEQG